MPEPDAIVLAIGGAVDRADIAAWCVRLQALLENGGDLVICDVGMLRRVDLAAVDLLARLQLTARRHGARLRIRRASVELVGLLAALGMTEVVPLAPDLAWPLEGQPKEGEQPRGVEEEADPGDAPV